MHSASFSQNYWTLNDIKEFTDELSIGQSKTTIPKISKFGSIFTYSGALHNIVYKPPKMPCCCGCCTTTLYFIEVEATFYCYINGIVEEILGTFGH